MYKLIAAYYQFRNTLFGYLKHADGLAPLALRLYLVPVFWMAGTKKWEGFESTVAWFGNPDWGLGLPFPELMAYLATWTEILGAVLLLLGLATRWIAIPLMITMVVAIVTVHLDHGWWAIASSDTPEVAARLGRAREILQQYGDYSWLTAKGGFVILQNGIEFAATYLMILFSLFFTGGGRYFSADYWLSRQFGRGLREEE